jgi:hypothetical protein
MGIPILLYFIITLLSVGGMGKSTANSDIAKEFVAFCKGHSKEIDLEFAAFPSLSRYAFNEIVAVLQR